MAEQKPDPFDLASGAPAIDGALRPKPKFADRISKRVILVALVFVGVMVFIFLGSLNQMDQKKPAAPVKKEKSAEKSEEAGGSAVPTDLKKPVAKADEAASEVVVGGKDAAGGKAALAANLAHKDGDIALPPPSKVVPPLGGGAIPTANETGNGVAPPPLTPQQQAENQAKQDRLTRSAQARANGMTAKAFDGEGGGAGRESAGSSELKEMRSALMQAGKNGGPVGEVPGGQAQKPPGGDQDEKMSFLKDAGKDNRGYLPHTPLPPISQNELKTGSFIPLVLETGINSDLPGMIAARSSEAIYDSTTGCRLLIPAMTKFVGKYDSKVAIGQGRMLVVWNSAIFRDGSELNLGGMQGYDSGGQAGLQSDVDNHYLRMFGVAFGLSMVTAGVQLSIPPPAVTTNGTTVAPSAAQAVSTALTQQFGQLGGQILGKYMNIQPTLKNYPGERFMIMVPNTIVFNKVWVNRCNGGSSK